MKGAYNNCGATILGSALVAGYVGLILGNSPNPSSSSDGARSAWRATVLSPYELTEFLMPLGYQPHRLCRNSWPKQ